MVSSNVLSLVRALSYGSAFVMVTAFILCLAAAKHYHWAQVTRTHCSSDQFFPSISAVVGVKFPEELVWRIGVAIFAIPQFILIAFHTWHYSTLVRGKHTTEHGTGSYHDDAIVYSASDKLIIEDTTIPSQSGSYFVAPFPVWGAQLLIYVLFFLLEHVGLLLLAFVSSTEKYEVHKFGFMAFLIGQSIEMTVALSMDKASYGKRIRSSLPLRHVGLNPVAEYHLRCKKRIVWANRTLLGLAMLFYALHTVWCPPYIYSFFGLCEWSFVFSNIIFHVFSGLTVLDTHSIETKSAVDFSSAGEPILLSFSPHIFTTLIHAFYISLSSRNGNEQATKEI